jgi:hypothetical protein
VTFQPKSENEDIIGWRNLVTAEVSMGLYSPDDGGVRHPLSRALQRIAFQ